MDATPNNEKDYAIDSEEMLASLSEMMGAILRDEEMPTLARYTAAPELHERLQVAGIPHTFIKSFDGYSIRYFGDLDDIDGRADGPFGSECVCSVVQHRASYGGREDLLEIMGLLTPEEAECDDVAGYLTVDDVFARIKAHYTAIGR